MTFRIPDWIGALVLAPLSVAFLTGAAWMYLRRRAFLKGAVTTVGVVTEVRAERSASDRGRTETYYSPVVRFYTVDGKTVVFTSAVATSASDYREGQQVPVVYDADRPEQAKIKSFARLWFVPLALLFCGLVQGIIALGLLAQWAKIKLDSQLIGPCVFTIVGLGLLTGALYAHRHRAPPSDDPLSDNFPVLVLAVMGLAFTAFGLAFMSKYIPV